MMSRTTKIIVYILAGILLVKAFPGLLTIGAAFARALAILFLILLVLSLWQLRIFTNIGPKAHARFHRAKRPSAKKDKPFGNSQNEEKIEDAEIID